MKPRMQLKQLQDPPPNIPMRYEQRRRIKTVVQTYHELCDSPGELQEWLRYIAQLPTYAKTMNMETGQWEE